MLRYLKAFLLENIIFKIKFILCLITESSSSNDAGDNFVFNSSILVLSS